MFIAFSFLALFISSLNNGLICLSRGVGMDYMSTLRSLNNLLPSNFFFDNL